MMRKKSGFTIIEQAIVLVPDFEKVTAKNTAFLMPESLHFQMLFT